MRRGAVLTRSVGAGVFLAVALAGCGGSGDGDRDRAAPTTAPSTATTATTVSTSAPVTTVGGAGPGSTTGPTIPGPSGTEPPVDNSRKVADAILQAAASGVSSSLVHVRGDGAVEVVLHAAAPVTPAQLGELAGVGAEVVSTAETPTGPGQPAAGLVQAWVPAGALPAVADLPWVVAVTPPAYPPTGG